jgi:penicillin-binding protein 1A
LGAADVTPLEVAAAYGAMANQGVYVRPYLVEEVRTRAGAPLERHALEASKAMEPAVAYVLTRMLEGVVDRGTAGSIADLPLAIAGKTGTTNDYTDAWFVGFEPSLAAAVWVGYDDKRISLGKREEGGRAALPIWMDFWGTVMKDRPIEEYKVPGNIVFVPVDGLGRPGRPGVPGVQMEAFIAGTEPRTASGAPAAAPSG